VKTESRNSKKLRASVLAGLLAAAMVLTGTFAWRSISQKATNVFVDARNPGGRVHDDFKGLENKDIYAENFTDKEDGVPVFARIKLLEYMETGEDAGLKRDQTGRQATPLVADAYINDPDTWQVYLPGADNDPFREFWNWTMGGETVYLPTFNKNKDSFSVEVNGTYEGEDGVFNTLDPYSDNEIYTLGQEVTENAFYDADDNTDDEYVAGTSIAPGAGGTEGVNYEAREETHTAKNTLHSDGIISIEEWKKAGSPICNKWVYDADGWFYWPEPIMPETATGLLLDKVDQRKQAGERSYYAIEVVGQFATANDWGDSTAADDDPAKGFYADGLSDDAKALLDKAASVVVGKDGAWYLTQPGTSAVYRQVIGDEGREGKLICAGADGLIGTADDRDDVVYVEDGITIDEVSYGNYYLKPTETEPYYRVNNRDKQLGTKSDTAFWLVEGSFPTGTVTPTPVTDVAVTNTTGTPQVKTGAVVNFTADVLLADEKLTEKEVTWSVKGNQDLTGTAIKAVDKTTGALTIGNEPVGTELTVVATSVLDSRKSGEVTVKVVDKVILVTMNGSDKVRAGGLLRFTGAVSVDGEAVDAPVLTWAAGDVSGAAIEGVTMDADSGELRVTEAVDVGTKIYVTATYNDLGRLVKSEPKAVEVMEANSAELTLTAAGGVSQVEAGQTDLAFSLTAVDKDGQSVDPTTTVWSVSKSTREVAADDVSITEEGKLSVGDRVTVKTVITVKAEITYTDATTGSEKTASGSTDLAVVGPTAVEITNTDVRVLQGNSLTVSALVKKGDGAYPSNAIKWSVSGGTRPGTQIDEITGELTVDANEPLDTQLTVTAASAVDETKATTMTFTVVAPYFELPAVNPLNNTITVDGVPYVLLVKDEVNHQALLLRDAAIRQTFNGSTNVWRDSGARAYLNGAYLNSLGTLQAYVKKVDITTRTADRTDFITTTDSVFLLSEADALGTVNGSTPDAKDYTVGYKLLGRGSLTANADGVASKQTWYTRSPSGNSRLIAISSGGDCITEGMNISSAYLRPAFWIHIK